MTASPALRSVRARAWPVVVAIVALAAAQGVVVLAVLPTRAPLAAATMWTGSLGFATCVAIGVQAALATLAVVVVVRQQRMDVAAHGATARARDWWALERWACLAVTALGGDVVALVVGIALGPTPPDDDVVRAALVLAAILAGPALAIATGVRWLVARARSVDAAEARAVAHGTRTSVVGRRIHPEHQRGVPTVTESTGPGRS